MEALGVPMETEMDGKTRMIAIQMTTLNGMTQTWMDMEIILMIVSQNSETQLRMC